MIYNHYGQLPESWKNLEIQIEEARSGQASKKLSPYSLGQMFSDVTLYTVRDELMRPFWFDFDCGCCHYWV